MSELWEGPGWWFASDGKWYPPDGGDGLSESVFNELGLSERFGPSVHADQEDTIQLSDGTIAHVSDGAIADRFSLGTDVNGTDVNEEESDLDEDIPRIGRAAEEVAEVPLAGSDGVPADEIDFDALEQEIDLDALEQEIDLAALDEGASELEDQEGEKVGVLALLLGSTAVKEQPKSEETSGWVASTTESGRGAEVNSGPLSTLAPRGADDRPSSVTRTTVGPPAVATDELAATIPPAEANGNASETSEREAGLASSTTPSPTRESVTKSPEPAEERELVAEQETAPTWDGTNRRRRGSLMTTLLVVALLLAILSGVLGSLWLRERSTAEDLSAELADVPQLDQATEIESLEQEIETLRLRNEQLERQLTEMSALVLELPAGRLTEIDLPFDVAFADEVAGRLIAMSASGQYVVFAGGVDLPITDSGQLGAAPTGLFAATGRAFVSSDTGRIDIIPVNPEVLPAEGFDSPVLSNLAGTQRVLWGFDAELGGIVRVDQDTGQVTDEFPIPTTVVDISVGAGSMWALGEDGVVYRVNTADLSLQTIDAGDDVIAISTSPDALWTLSASDGSLRRIDPVTGAVLVTVPVGRDPIDVEFVGSSVWVALRSGSTLIEVDTRTSAVVSRTELSSEPAKLFQGTNALYVATAEDAGTLFKVDSLEAEADEPVQGELAQDGAVEDAAGESAESDGS